MQLSNRVLAWHARGSRFSAQHHKNKFKKLKNKKIIFQK
jgi:hypothetical protein